MGDILFAGEAIGTRVELPSGKPYLRPSTPPRFMLDVALESLDTLLALDPEPKYTAFAHYGLTQETFAWCRRARKQLIVWVESIRELCGASEENLEERLFTRLMEVDPLYGRGRFVGYNRSVGCDPQDNGETDNGETAWRSRTSRPPDSTGPSPRWPNVWPSLPSDKRGPELPRKVR